VRGVIDDQRFVTSCSRCGPARRPGARRRQSRHGRPHRARSNLTDKLHRFARATSDAEGTAARTCRSSPMCCPLALSAAILFAPFFASPSSTRCARARSPRISALAKDLTRNRRRWRARGRRARRFALRNPTGILLVAGGLVVGKLIPVTMPDRVFRRSLPHRI